MDKFHWEKVLGLLNKIRRYRDFCFQEKILFFTSGAITYSKIFEKYPYGGENGYQK